MARSRGAHVIATVRGDTAEARQLGAEEAYDAGACNVLAALHAVHPGGVDAVLDLVNGSDVISRDAEILKSGGNLVSTIHAADEKWFAERHITAYNIMSSATQGPGQNPSSSPQGLSAVARMAAEGTITVRIGSRVELEGAGQMLEKLRSGGLHGKAVIRI